MLPKKRIPVHPGEVLIEEFLKPMGITQSALAERIQVPIQRVNEIVRGKRNVSPETAWLLSEAFGTSPQFWLGLQTNHDLAACRPKKKIKRFKMQGA